MRQGSVKVLAMAMNKQMVSTLALFFRQYCNNVYEIVNDKGDLLIADFDNYDQSALLAKFMEKNTELPTILLSLKNDLVFSTPNISLLRKPLDLKELTARLEVIKQGLPSIEQLKSPFIFPPPEVNFKIEQEPKPKPHKKKATARQEQPTNQPKEKDNNTSSPDTVTKKQRKYPYLPYTGFNVDVDLDDPQAIEKISYYQNKYLHYYLQQLLSSSQRNNKMMQLTVGKVAVFTTSHDGQAIKTSITASRLKAISSIAMASEMIEVIEIYGVEWADIEGEECRILTMIWETSLWASKGRLPWDVSLQTEVGLLRWPNITRILKLPHAAQIAALWIKQPTSLIDTIHSLNIPQRYVFSFFVATRATNMLYYPSQQNLPFDNKTNTKADAADSEQQKALFREMLTHLRKSD